MASRWDYIHDLKPIPIVDHFIAEAGKFVAKDLEAWPVPIEGWEHEPMAERFRELLGPASRRPDWPVYEAAFKLARWDLEREFEAYDDFVRNERFKPAVGTDDERALMLLISRYLVEQMLAISEATEGRIKRPQLVKCLDRAERELAKLRSPLVLA